MRCLRVYAVEVTKSQRDGPFPPLRRQSNHVGPGLFLAGAMSLGHCKQIAGCSPRGLS